MVNNKKCTLERTFGSTLISESTLESPLRNTLGGSLIWALWLWQTENQIKEESRKTSGTVGTKTLSILLRNSFIENMDYILNSQKNYSMYVM